MSIPGITCPKCNSVQCTLKASRPGRAQFKCKKCSTVFWSECEIPQEIAVSGKKKPVIKSRKKAVPVPRTEAEDYDGSTPLKNIKHELFVRALYQQGDKLNQAAAYIKAGYNVKTEKIASAAATRMLNDVNIFKRLQWLQAQVATADILSREEALKILTQQSRVKVTDFMAVDIDGALFVKMDENMPHIDGLKKIRVQTIVDENGNEIKAIELRDIEIFDKIKAIERIAKMQGWDKPTEINVGGTSLAEVFRRTAEIGLTLPSKDKQKGGD